MLNTIRKKVWLCVNVAFLGFLVATGFALYTNQELKAQLVHIRDLDFNLALYSAKLQNQVEIQTSYYEESFLFGLPESAQKAMALSPEILTLFERISKISHHHKHTTPEEIQTLSTLQQNYRTYDQDASQLYPLLAGGEDPDQHVASLRELAAAQNSSRKQLNSLTILYRESFSHHVNDLIDIASQNNRLLSVFFISLLAIMILVVNITANRTLINPLAQIKDAIQAFGKGQRSFPALKAMNAEDDIGELGTAIVKMVDDLETTTVSKAYLDDILRYMSDSLIVTSDDFMIRRVNHATLALLGYSLSELTGQHIGKILLEFKKDETISKAADPEINLYSNAEKTYLTRDGRKIPVLLSTSSLNNGTKTTQGLVYVAKDITERKIAEYKLEQLAQFDFLTGLANRLSFSERMKQTLSRAQREGRNVGLMFLDLDRFKAINDSLGHSFGDALLKIMGKRLTCCIRESDTLARIGGDEFAVILDNIQHQQDIIQTANRILTTFKKPIIHEENEIFSSTSIGIALYPSDAQNTEDLLKKADFAMYKAKQAGGNTYRFFSEPP